MSAKAFAANSKLNAVPTDAVWSAIAFATVGALLSAAVGFEQPWTSVFWGLLPAVHAVWSKSRNATRSARLQPVALPASSALPSASLNNPVAEFSAVTSQNRK